MTTTSTRVLLRDSYKEGADFSPGVGTGTRHNGDDDFTVGSALDTAGTRFSGATAWSWRNQGAASVVYDHGRMVMTVPYPGAGDQYRIIQQVPPALPFEFSAKLTQECAAVNYTEYGICCINNATGKFTEIVGAYNVGFGKIFVNKINSVTAFGGTAHGPLTNYPAQYGGCFKIRCDATTMHFYASNRGEENSWMKLDYTETFATHMGAAPTHIGIVGACKNGVTLMITAEWWRVSV